MYVCMYQIDRGRILLGLVDGWRGEGFRYGDDEAIGRLGKGGEKVSMF